MCEWIKASERVSEEWVTVTLEDDRGRYIMPMCRYDRKRRNWVHLVAEERMVPFGRDDWELADEEIEAVNGKVIAWWPDPEDTYRGEA